MIVDFLRVIYDDIKHKYFVLRPDCPGDAPKEITIGGAIDLMRNVQRYEWDGWKENHKNLGQ